MLEEKKQKNKERNYLFDNMRGLLIFLVVVGHLLRTQMGFSNALDSIYFFIYLFHMPAFIFVTGYFSKNAEKCRVKAFQSFLVPYVLLNITFWAYNRYVLDVLDKPFRIFQPQWGMWFFMAVFIWKIMLKDMIRIRFILPLSIIVGLLSGFTGEFTSKLSLARVIAFLPFFLLGFYCTEEHINKIKKIPHFIAALVVAGYGILSYVIVRYDVFSKGNLYMKGPYTTVKKAMFSGVSVRLFIYISAALIIISLINLFSTRNTIISQIGKNSVTVYVIHLFILLNLKKIDVPWEGTKYYIIYALILAVIITFVCSRQIVLHVYDAVINKIVSLIIDR